MLKSGFTHRLNGEPIPPRRELPPAKPFKAERDGKRAALVSLPKYSGLTIASKQASDKTNKIKHCQI